MVVGGGAVWDDIDGVDGDMMVVDALGGDV